MNKANEMAIQVVQRYIERLERQYIHPWLSSEFAQRSYSISAANDILDELRANDTMPPLMIIEEYRDKMNEYSCINSFGSFMFSVAYDIAEDISNEIIKSYY